MRLKPRKEFLFNWESIVAIIAFALVAVLLLIAYRAVEQPLGPVPINVGGDTIVARSGVAGFEIDKVVCDNFKVERKLAPDVGWTYELSRNLNGVQELVQINTDFEGKVINKDFNRHFTNTALGQAPEPAYVTDEGLKCIKEKAG